MLRINIKIIFYLIVLTSFSLPQKRIALVVPAELKEQKSINQDLINDITHFEIFLIQNKIDYSALYSDEISYNLSEKFEALIFPTSTSISEEIFYKLEKLLENGLGIMSFGNISVFKDDEQRNIFNELYGVETLKIDQSVNPTFVQHFNFNSKILNQKNDFKLLISNPAANWLYKVNAPGVFSFGCYNDKDDVTTSFYGFKSSGRFAHFGFSFSKIISDYKSIKEFRNLLLSLLVWMRKNSGIWITNSEGQRNYFLLLLDLTKGSIISETDLKKIVDQNIPVLIAADEPQKLINAFVDYKDRVSFALKPECKHNIESLINSLNETKIKVEFLILEKDCFDDRDIKRLSFAGIRTILTKDDSASYYNIVYNLLKVPYELANSTACVSNQLMIIDYPDKINCDEILNDNFLRKISEVKREIKTFDREELINDFLISGLKINTYERDGELNIVIQNPGEIDVQNCELIVDHKNLSDKIIYEMKVNDISRYVKKDSLTGYYRIYFDTISPKAVLQINIFYKDNI